MMEEQTLRPENQETRKDEALSWQFILVLVVIAALIPLLSSSFLSSVERAERPIPTPAAVDFSGEAYTDLANATLTATYDDASGISMQYPEDWYVLPLSPGFFVVSNHELDLSATEFPPDIVLVQVQSGTLDTFTLPDGTLPEPGTDAHTLMAGLLEGAPEPMEITDLEVDGAPAASIMIEGQGSARQLVLITPDETSLVIVDTNTAEEMWPNVEALVARILDSMTFNMATAG